MYSRDGAEWKTTVCVVVSFFHNGIQNVSCVHAEKFYLHLHRPPSLLFSLALLFSRATELLGINSKVNVF